MKKLLFVAAIAVFSLASCKKDTTCTCTTTYTDTEPGYVAEPARTYITTGKKLKKSDAALWCQSSVDTYSHTAYLTPPTSTYYTRTSTSTCELK
ncbi:MAG: hypothetical protein EPN85_12775 [Bacteroidetes bacterium]|nr:MAG: hypothetical protein EPN85_12775 [Bacteroidota bacterium]